MGVAATTRPDRVRPAEPPDERRGPLPIPNATPDPNPPDFRGLLLMLRGRAGVTQRELAAHAGVSERAIQAWEAGLSFPSAPSLQRLIGLILARGAFTAGR